MTPKNHMEGICPPQAGLLLRPPPALTQPCRGCGVPPYYLELWHNTPKSKSTYFLHPLQEPPGQSPSSFMCLNSALMPQSQICAFGGED